TSPPVSSATVRHTPLIATLSPSLMSSHCGLIASRRNIGPSDTDATATVFSTIPVNMHPILVEFGDKLTHPRGGAASSGRRRRVWYSLGDAKAAMDDHP